MTDLKFSSTLDNANEKFREKGIDGKYSLFGDALFNKEIPKADYFKNRLFIGQRISMMWTRRKDNDKMHWKEGFSQPHYMDISDSHRYLIIGNPNTGKTFLTRGIGSRYTKSGYNCIYPVDIKGEYNTNAKPLQPKFHHLLGEHEKPEGIPTVILVPKFLEKFHRELPEGATVFQFSLSDLNEKDFYDFFGFEPTDETAMTIWRAIEEKKVTTLADLKSFVDNKSSLKMHHQKRDSIVKKIDNAVATGFLGDENNIDLLSYMDKGMMISQCLMFWERANPMHCYLYIALLIRKITQLRQDGLIKNKIVFFIDEAHVTVPRDSEPPCKREVLYSISVSRYLGITFFLITQLPSQLPKEEILKQITVLFAPFNIDTDLFKELLDLYGFWEKRDVFTDKWSGLIRKLNRHEWVIMDRNNKEFHRVKPASPLCHHLTEGG